MEIKLLKDRGHMAAGDRLKFTSWKNNSDGSIQGTIVSDQNASPVHFERGEFIRLNVFKSTVTVEVSNLGLPADLEDDLQCHLEVSNDSIHSWDVDGDYFKRTEEVNQFLRDAGVPMDAEINLCFSW
jgi:hypothetical protein